jgi:hypothetical protein
LQQEALDDTAAKPGEPPQYDPEYATQWDGAIQPILISFEPTSDEIQSLIDEVFHPFNLRIAKRNCGASQRI